MKHRLKWYLAFFIVFTLLGCFSVPAKETEALTTYATYHNDETAFSLEWPNGFTESISPHEDTKFTAIHRDGRVCVQVTVTPMTSSLTTKEKKHICGVALQTMRRPSKKRRHPPCPHGHDENTGRALCHRIV